MIDNSKQLWWMAGWKDSTRRRLLACSVAAGWRWTAAMAAAVGTALLRGGRCGAGRDGVVGVLEMTRWQSVGRCIGGGGGSMP